MKIWILDKYAGEDCFNEGIEQEFYATESLARSKLDEYRNDFRNTTYGGKPLYEFYRDSEREFACSNGKWNYEYSFYPQEVVEE